jgi:MFS family permease
MTQSIGLAGSVLCTSAAGWLLDRYSFPQNYVLCFACAALLSAVSWFWLSRVREPAYTPEQQPFDSSSDYWRKLPAILGSDPNFRRYLVGRAVVNLGLMSTGFLAVYAVERWNLPDEWGAWLATSLLIGQGLSNFLSGALGDRHGHKLVLQLGALGVVLALILALTVDKPWWFYAVFALIGASVAGIRLGGNMITLEFSQPALRPTYIGVSNTVNGIVLALAPLLGGWIAEMTGYRPLFGVALAVSFTGLVLMRWIVREPRASAAAVQEA